MIPFKQVYRMKHEGDTTWTVVMGLTPLAQSNGLWMARASSNRPEQVLLGRVFEGKDGKIVLIGDEDQVIFEPLTLERWDDMKDDIHGFNEIRAAITTDNMLQGWYWDEFAHNGDGVEIDQTTVATRLQDMTF